MIQFDKQIENFNSHLIGDGAVFGFLPFKGGVGVRLRNSIGGFGQQFCGAGDDGGFDSALLQRCDSIAEHHEVLEVFDAFADRFHVFARRHRVGVEEERDERRGSEPLMFQKM